MIISRTPFRISLFGGGTDYPAWYRVHGGAVLGGTIDKYCYLTCRYLPPFFEHRFRLVYSKIETCNRVDEIRHPAARAALELLKFDRGVEIHHDGDLPARSGMGSSSSFSVGLLHALHALRGQMPTRRELADQGIHIEREMLGETVGCQDQILAAFGGFNHITFTRGGEYVVRPVTVSAERMRDLSSHLLVLYTGIIRTASTVAKKVVDRFDVNKRQLRILRDMVDEGLAAIASEESLAAVGDLLHEAWIVKRSLGDGVSNPEIDAIYDTARASGATGGKILGAGGGGFMLLFAPPSRHEEIKSALPHLIHVPFRFCSGGSEIVMYEPEQEYQAAEIARIDNRTAPFREQPPEDDGE